MSNLWYFLKHLWRDIKDSLSGTEHDFTTVTLGRAVTLLAIPMVLELLMESVFALVDIFFVSRLGADAVASVGLTESVLTLVFSIATGIAMATTAVVARRVGEKNKEAAGTAAAQAIYLGILVSIPMTLAGILYPGRIFQWMGASEEVISVGGGYFTVMLAGNATIMLLFVINAVFRGAGDAVLAMRVLWFANILNIFLDPLLIFGIGPFPEMGVTGAAVATTFSRGMGIVYQVVLLRNRRNRVPVYRRHLRLNAEVLLHTARVAVGGSLQFLIATASWLGLVRIIAVFGSPAIAGYTIAIRVIIFAILPSWGMSNAAATLVGQNLGAGKPDRAEKSVWLTGLANTVFMVFVTVTFVAFAEPISRLFTDQAEVLPFAVDCLRYISYGYVFYAYGMVMVQAFNGAGDTYTPTVINLFCYWLFQIPLAYMLALPAGLGAQGVFVAIAVSESLIAVVAVLVFRRGRWKTQAV
ncbi:MAG: MATE family efflux transporter [Acidobacteriota bacterium]